MSIGIVITVVLSATGGSEGRVSLCGPRPSICLYYLLFYGGREKVMLPQKDEQCYLSSASDGNGYWLYDVLNKDVGNALCMLRDKLTHQDTRRYSIT